MSDSDTLRLLKHNAELTAEVERLREELDPLRAALKEIDQNAFLQGNAAGIHSIVRTAALEEEA
ncbi:MAG: hypothetical protein ACREI2_14800 [Nitrospiraceae bacterium]